MGFNFTAEFGMAMEKGPLEAQTERVAGLCLLAMHVDTVDAMEASFRSKEHPLSPLFHYV
jgi:hypothetical protein